MSNFKEGDLVEVINHPHLNGERFVLSEGKVCKISSKTPSRFAGKRVFSWRTDFNSIHNTFDKIWLPEYFLKKINPDTGHKSCFTFEELLDKMKSGRLEGVER